MSLLGSDGQECYVCGKEVDEEDCIEMEGKKFCCKKCEQKFEEEEHEDQEEVCQFC